MARGHGTYSRVVAWLKIVLPLLALIVMGTVFLINSDDSFDTGFTFSEGDLNTLDAGSFLNQPQIDGTTDKGEPFHLIADRISPQEGNQNLVTVSALSGNFTFLSGEWVKLTANEAIMDIKAQTMLFNSGGRIETSDGNTAEIGSLLIHMTNGNMSGTDINANGPLGQISADQFRIDANETENRMLWFENNVMMRYDLRNEGE